MVHHRLAALCRLQVLGERRGDEAMLGRAERLIKEVQSYRENSSLED